MDFQPIVQDLIMAIFAALVTLIAFFVKKGIAVLEIYIDQKIGAAQFSMLKDQAATVVRYLEQSPIFKDLAGSDKKERAILELINFCNANNIPVNRVFIDQIIEEAVHIVNETKLPPLEGIVG